MNSVLIDILVLAVAAFNLFLGITVLMRNPKNNVNRVFFGIGLTFAVWCIVLFFYQHPVLLNSLFWIRATYLSVCGFIICLFAFTFIFPTTRFKKALPHAVLLCLDYVGITFYLLFFTDLFVVGVVKDPQGVYHTLLGPAYPWWTAMTWLPLIWGAVNLIIKSRTATKLQKLQMKYFWMGFILFGIFVCIPDVIIPLLTGDTSYFLIGTSTNLVFSGMVAYVILRHRLLDIRFVIARAITYLFLLVIIGAFYATALYYIGSIFFPTDYTPSRVIFNSLIAVIVAFTFPTVKDMVGKWTDAILFKGGYNSQALLKSLSTTMATTLEIDELTTHSLNVLLHEMRITYGTYVLYVNKNGQEYIEERGTSNVPGMRKDILDALLKQNQKVIIYEELQEGYLKDLLRLLNISVVLQLSTHNKNIGVLVLGEKASGEIYSSQDIEIFEILSPELSLALHNSQEYEQIKQFNATLQYEIDAATQDLREANAKLQQLDHLKDEFVSLASHELRTPMTSIKSYIWMVMNGKGGPVTEKQKYYLDRSYKSTERLIRLVNNMLDVSRIESGRIIIDKKQVSMHEIVEDVVSEVRPRAQELNVKVDFTKGSNIPSVYADADKIKQVLFNLIGNSLKFTPPGGSVTVTFTVQDGLVATSVKDTGKGIAPENMNKLFKKFGILEGTYTSSDASLGSGLGLYITKSIIELHGGHISVSSEGEGKGTDFTFTLPIFSNQAEKSTKVQEKSLLLHTPTVN